MQASITSGVLLDSTVLTLVRFDGVLPEQTKLHVLAPHDHFDHSKQYSLCGKEFGWTSKQVSNVKRFMALETSEACGVCRRMIARRWRFK